MGETLARKSLRARALAGETLVGAMVFEFFTPGIAQILRLAGAEFVLYDMEHAGLGIEGLKQQCAYCRGIGIAPMVRVPRGEYHFLARALDVGAQGVMVPMVESAGQARLIAESTHYPPKGRRGAAFGFAHDHYEPGPPQDKMKAADQRNLIIAQIETERGLDAVEAIAAVEGIDALWVGHFDLTNFLGIPGQFDHPRYIEALKRIVAAGRRHKKALGYMPSDEKAARAHMALGFNLLAAGTDQAILMQGYKSLIAAMRDRP
jgi:2-keto-3-deoxy-L-rhamnonate aldolase RhmA